MGYAGTRIMCDADSHIMETFDFVKDHADPDLRDLIPKLKLGGAGRLAEKAIANALARRRSDPSPTRTSRAPQAKTPENASWWARNSSQTGPVSWA